MKKLAGDIIILYMCTKNQNHMIYSSWDTEWDRNNFLLFWAIFSPFTPLPLMILKIKILKKKKKWKKCLEILSFYTCMGTINEWYTGPEIRGATDRNILSFWAIFCLFSPLTTWKIKTLKLKKTAVDIIILHICTINDNHMIYGSWDMQRDRQNFLSFWTVFCLFTPLTTWKI